MDFYDTVRQVLELLQRDGRMSYRALKRQFDLDDEALADLKEELLFAYPVIDAEGRGLVWIGEAAAPASAHTHNASQIQRSDSTPLFPY